MGLTKMKTRWFSSGRDSWNDPEQLGLKVMLAMVYMAGLVAFQRYTGLLDLRPSSEVRTTPVISHEAALFWLQGQKSPLMRSLLSLNSSAINETDIEASGNETSLVKSAKNLDANKAGEVGHNETTEGEAELQDPLFPKDLFTMDQIKSGFVAFYIIGVIYMFVALAIVCDEFFVPSLDVIIEKLGCSEDVAGATFMAAGGSAPELFTSAIGVFIAFSDVGIGTIVGSAVFNILFVIGMCALFSKTVLYLTWWPLLRDCTFYSISLLTLIAFFLDEEIYWYEAAILLAIYGTYVYFMKYNVQAEMAVKRLFGGNKVHESHDMQHHAVPAANGQGHTGYSGVPILHSGSHFHHGLLQLMIHTIDPLHDGRVDEKAAQLHAIASLQSILDRSGAKGGNMPVDGVNGNNQPTSTHNQGLEMSQFDAHTNADQLSKIGVSQSISSQANLFQNEMNGGANNASNEEEEAAEPLDLSWPDAWNKRITYVLFLPLVLPLWITLPDTRRQEKKKYFVITFAGSIMWIAVFSYLMVWWATISGNAFSIPPEVMGLTFLAAGTSIPDLFTSVIVARKGFGDMAVSSSVGSNIFDVTVGLPLPWFLFTMVFQKPVPVSSTGMVCSISILFGMLVLVFLSILMFSWKMTKGMGITMFLFYFVFVAITLGFEYDFYDCPI